MASRDGVVVGEDGVSRCWWGTADPLYAAYHDREWGVPVADDRLLFETLCLEGFQAGLSWLTVLRKRPAFRRAFDRFDPARVAKFTANDVDRLVGEAAIIRHRGKIESTINNARQALAVRDEYGTLAAYLWEFEPERRRRGLRRFEVPNATTESRALSKDLKRRGWSFVGPTTVYAFMQAMGLVNDHLEGCTSWTAAEELRRTFVVPTR
jgi:DNA-3-methyladenine glycosylase I